jgi:hypothetical protein
MTIEGTTYPTGTMMYETNETRGDTRRMMASNTVAA